MRKNTPEGSNNQGNITNMIYVVCGIKPFCYGNFNNTPAEPCIKCKRGIACVMETKRRE